MLVKISLNLSSHAFLFWFTTFSSSWMMLIVDLSCKPWGAGTSSLTERRCSFWVIRVWASLLLTYSPWLKPGDSGIITNLACLNSRSYEFSPQWTMPCPHQIQAKNNLSPSDFMFMAAFLSRLWTAPHSGQIHVLTFRFFISLFWQPQQEHNWLEG